MGMLEVNSKGRRQTRRRRVKPKEAQTGVIRRLSSQILTPLTKDTRAALHELRTISRRQRPGKDPEPMLRSWAPAKSLNLAIFLFRAAWGGGGPCRPPVFTFSSLGLAHPLH